MIERKWGEYLAAAGIGAVLFVLMVGWMGRINDRIIARDCDSMGMVMLKGEPHRCEPMEVRRG